MKKININTTASSGIAMGKVFIAKKLDLTANTNTINSVQIENELELFETALEKSVEEIKILAKNSPIFSAHLEVASDPTLIDSVKTNVNQFMNAQLALEKSTKEICELFESLDDDYLKERALDIKDVSKRIMSHLKGVSLNVFDEMEEESIVFAEDLTPSDTANMDFSLVKGFITACGGVTSHVVIIARQLSLPAMVGVKDIFSQINEDDFVILDGIDDAIIINPDSGTIKSYHDKEKDYEHLQEKYNSANNLPAITKDGHAVKLYANVGNIPDVEFAVKSGSEGIGLFRTEFLYMENTHFPTEEEQFCVYKEAIQKNNGEMIIRTMDIGGDKELPYYVFDKEENPFLGWRAIRMSIDMKNLFKTQLKAILRASAYGDIKIMYPMIISVDEFNKANALLEECKVELKTNNIDFNENIKTGAMIETPSAVFVAEELAQKADFFSIGTNDLTQYILAVDRGNPKIAHLYDTFNPSVLKAIKMVIDAGHKHGIEVGICGEFASDEKAIPILIGMGIDEFSMASSLIAKSRYLIRELSFEEEKLKV